MSKTGKVFLVGGGPGDPELLTLKAHRILGEADAVVYDRLVSPNIVDLVPAGCSRIFVGKAAGNHTVPQDRINEILFEQACLHDCVVRLKGGDPFTFGRGGEEIAHLSERGVSVEVVPGITAATACAAQMGIPLTHRDVASGVQFISGHAQADATLNHDWDKLADPHTTLVVYMGLSTLPVIAAELMAHGLAGETPLFAIEKGSQEQERSLLTTLAKAPEAVRDADFRPPTLFIIGGVAAMARASTTPSTYQKTDDPRITPQVNGVSRLRIAAIALALTTSLALVASATLAQASDRSAELENMLIQDCGSCHGLTMRGGLGSPLTPQALADKDDTYLEATILDGHPGTAMPPWSALLTPKEVAWMVQRLRTGVSQ